MWHVINTSELFDHQTWTFTHNQWGLEPRTKRQRKLAGRSPPSTGIVGGLIPQHRMRNHYHLVMTNIAMENPPIFNRYIIYK